MRLVKAVDGGAEPRGSLKISLGEMVWVDPATELMEVKAEFEAAISQDKSPVPKAGPRPAPRFESNELLLFRSAMFATLLLCRILGVELEWNKGTGGRCWICCCWWCCSCNEGCCWRDKPVVDEGAELA